MDLSEKIVFVTGAKGGLGTFVIESFLQAGARVFGVSRCICANDFSQVTSTAEMAAQWFVNILMAYAAVGLLFGVAFVTAGIARVDPAAKGSGAGFRLIILPGVAALWPLLLGRWIQKGKSNL